MLLLAEPFIPGDMVTFQRGGVRCVDGVEYCVIVIDVVIFYLWNSALPVKR